MEFAALEKVLPDHEIRPISLDDVPALVDLVTRLTTVVLGEPDVSEAELRDDLIGPHYELGTDTFVAVAPDGRVTAYGQGYDERDGSGWIDVFIDPALDEARQVAVADAGIAACATRILESAKARGASEIHLTANLYESETLMRDAYERAGLPVETIYWRMQREISATETLEAPAVPEGFRIGKVDPRDDVVIEQAYHLFNDTFSEHHGFDGEVKSLPDYIESVRTAEAFDRDAWWFGWHGDEPVGLLIGDNRREESGVGFVRSVGVQKRIRGRGIARALLLSAFADYRDRGRTAVQLGVDTGNVTGATRLYESVGMTSLHTAIALGREVTL
ncbi:MAG: GNAT family N-acetyltransferase [Actinomycetia bacterium]|nr:GNAT family N-acetyltransferase [Actinomycetes bacterium]